VFFINKGGGELKKEEYVLADRTNIKSAGRLHAAELLYFDWIQDHMKRRGTDSERRRRLEEREDHGEHLLRG
jgi:hypothetical protein